MRWKCLISNEEGKYPRTDHSLTVCRGKPIIYGGATEESDHLILTLNKQKQSLKQLESYSIPENAKRRNHIAFVINNVFYVFGGFDLQSYSTTDSLIYMDLEEKIWYSAPVASAKKIPKLEKTCFVQANYQQELILSKNNPTEIYNTKIYFFGGNTRKGHFNDKLFKLHYKGEQFVVEEVRAKSYKPVGRIDASLAFFKSEDCLILHGGESESNEYLADFHRFNLKSRIWERISLKGSSIQPRRLHCAAIYEHKMLIFGGVSGNMYCSSQIMVVDLTEDFGDSSELLIVEKKDTSKQRKAIRFRN